MDGFRVKTTTTPEDWQAYQRLTYRAALAGRSLVSWWESLTPGPRGVGIVAKHGGPSLSDS